MTDFHVIIPARYHSTRLPAKAIQLIGELPMIVHVCHRAADSGAKSVTVATDNETIKNIVEKAGFSAVMTRDDHPSGSDRLFEAAEIIGLDDNDNIVNVQGDEPFIPPINISRVAALLDETQSPMATLCCEIQSAEEALDPNAVKVVFSVTNKALYFSRSLLPFNRNHEVKQSEQLHSRHYRHIGIYAYKKKFLKQFINWSPSYLETTESLEQLRVLENGYQIGIDCLPSAPPHGVDTPEDLAAARNYFNQLKGKA